MSRNISGYYPKTPEVFTLIQLLIGYIYPIAGSFSSPKKSGEPENFAPSADGRSLFRILRPPDILSGYAGGLSFGLSSPSLASSPSGAGAGVSGAGSGCGGVGGGGGDGLASDGGGALSALSFAPPELARAYTITTATTAMIKHQINNITYLLVGAPAQSSAPGLH